MHFKDQFFRRTKLRSDEDIWKEISGSSAEKCKDTRPVEENKQESEPIDEIKSEKDKEDNPVHRVHFDFDEAASDHSSSSESPDPEAPLSLKFKFTNNDVTPRYSENMEYRTPWDIGNNYKKRKQHGILKPAVESVPIQTGNSGISIYQIKFTIV